MDRDPNLYAGTSGPLTLDAFQPVSCPLGQIVYAGTKWDSRATYAHAPGPGFFRPTPHFLLVYTLEGEADYADSTGLRTVLRPGDLLFAAPGVEQSYGPRPGSRWSECFLWLAGPAFAAWHAQGIPGPRTRVLRLDPVRHWLGRLADLAAPPGERDSPLLRICAVQALIAEGLRRGEAAERAVSAPWLDEACRLLEGGTLTSPALPQVARRLGLSYALFRKRFTALTGRSPGRHRAEALVRRASRMLAQDARPIGDIAAELGFHDQFHFSRTFRRAVGLPPREFRRRFPAGS